MTVKFCVIKFLQKALTNRFKSSNIICANKNAPLAQLVEQLTLNQWVPGSSP